MKKITKEEYENDIDYLVQCLIHPENSNVKICDVSKTVMELRSLLRWDIWRKEEKC